MEIWLVREYHTNLG